MGIREVNLQKSKSNGSLLLNFDTYKSANINEQALDLSEQNLVIENEVLSLQKNSDTGVTLVNNKPYIITPEFSGYLSEYNNSIKNAELSFLLVILKEITTPKRYKKALNFFQKQAESSAVCSLWDQVFIYKFGLTRETAEFGFGGQAEAVALYEYTDGDSDGCYKIGGVSSSCAYDNSGCVASQGYCCP